MSVSAYMGILCVYIFFFSCCIHYYINNSIIFSIAFEALNLSVCHFVQLLSFFLSLSFSPARVRMCVVLFLSMLCCWFALRKRIFLFCSFHVLICLDFNGTTHNTAQRSTDSPWNHIHEEEMMEKITNTTWEEAASKREQSKKKLCVVPIVAA